MRAALEHGLALAKETNWLMVVPYLAALGTANVQEGRVAEGIGLLEEAIAESTVSNRAQQAMFMSQLSEAYLAAARPGDALRVAREGLEGARQRQERGDAAWNLRAIAEALPFADPGEADAAARHYTDAVVLADELGMRPLAAHCRFGLAKLHLRLDKRKPAREHLAAATTLYRAMGMQRSLAEAEVELTKLA